MANIPSLPITIVAKIVPGSLSVNTTYNNPSSMYDGYPYTFTATLEISPAVNSDDRIIPNAFNYDAYHVTEGMWFGQTNGSAYQIITAAIPTDATHIDVTFKDVDLFNLLNDSSISGSNTPTEGNFGVLFNLSEDGDPILSSVELQRANLPDINYWLNDLYGRFQYRNLIASYYNNNPDNLIYSSGYTVGQLVYLDSFGQFQVVDSTVQSELEKAFGIITSVNEPEDGNMTVKPFGKITGGLNLTGIGNVGDLLYYDSTATSSNYLTTTKPANYPLPVYIKISNNSAAFLGWPLTTGVSGTSGGASGTSGVSGTSGSSGVSGIIGGQIYYFNLSVSSDVSGLKEISLYPSGAGQTTINTSLSNNQTGALVEDFITPADGLGFTVIPAGIQRFHLHFLKPASNDHIQAYIEIELANSSGVGYGQTIASGISEIGWVDAVTPVEVQCDLTVPTSMTILPTDRMIVRVYLNNQDSAAHTVTLFTEGSAYYSFVQTTVGAMAGTSGTSGSAGSSGQSGTSGVSGINGVDGTSGISGTTGSSGSSGESGTSGSSGQSTNYVGVSYDTIDLSTVSIGNNLTLTTSIDLDYTAGQNVIVSAGWQKNIIGTVVSYNKTNGELIIYVTKVVGTSIVNLWDTNLTGNSGLDGTSGASGSSGTSGQSGTSGVSGINGVDGTSGSSGSSGESGTSGIDGINGTSGSSGESGTSGLSGTSGSSGDSFKWMGVWDGTPSGGSNISYGEKDVVYYNGTTYIFINPVASGIGSTEPGVNPDWDVMAVSGSSGASGSSGSSGNASSVTGMTLNGTVLEIQNSDNTSQTVDFDPLDTIQNKEGVTTHGFIFFDEANFNQIPFDNLMGTTSSGYSDVMFVELLESDLTAKLTYVVVDVVNTGSTMNYIVLLPNLPQSYEGKVIKFVTKRNGLAIYNDILVTSKWDAPNQGNDYRIIATNIKTRVSDIGYFLPLETLETTEILFDGYDWLVTDVQKQGYFTYQPNNYTIVLSNGTYGTAGSYKNRDINNLL